MNEHSDRDTRPDEVIRAVGEAFAVKDTADLTDQMRHSLKAFREDLREHPYVKRLEWRPARGRYSAFWRRAAVLVGPGLAAAAVLIVLSFSNGTPTWAEVAESFRSVPYFSATVFIKEDVLSDAQQFELWMGQGGRARLRVAKQVIFARRGEVLKAFDIEQRKEVDPDRRGRQFLEMLGSQEEFSLDTVMRTFRGEWSETTPGINADATISEDLVVFDIESSVSPEWMRIWALRTSRLPVRILIWDPRGYDTTEVSFTYSKEQPDAAFDPDAFAAVLKDSSKGKANRAYAYLKDPGGRPITPDDLFETTGYHVPTVEDVGITQDGVVWVIAGKSANRTPEGRTFYGFSRLTDDLSREYLHAFRWHRLDGDRSFHTYVPVDYPFDKRVPGKLTFICEVEENDPREKGDLIGTVEITQWRQNENWPERGSEAEVVTPVRTVAGHYQRTGNWAKLRLILDSIPGEPEDSTDAFYRERLRLSMLIKRKKFEEALELAERLYPLIERDYMAVQSMRLIPAPPTGFKNHILALAALERIDEAKALFDRTNALSPSIIENDNLTEVIRAGREQNARREADLYLSGLAQSLSSTARLSVEDINYLLGLDITTDERFKYFWGWDWNPQHKGPEYDAWREHTEKVAQYYTTNPLPDGMELLERPDERQLRFFSAAIPGIRTHRLQPLTGTVKAYFRDYRDPGGLSVPEDLADTELSYDLVFRKDIAADEQKAFVALQLGLEFTEIIVPRKVLVARYDGRPLKGRDEVKAPVPRREGQQGPRPGVSVGQSSPGATMSGMLWSLAYYQNMDLPDDRKLLIIDETGIRSEEDPDTGEEPVRICRETIYWRGEGAMEIAEKWFEEEFGVTFTEEVREMPVKVLRKKADPTWQ